MRVDYDNSSRSAQASLNIEGSGTSTHDKLLALVRSLKQNSLNAMTDHVDKMEKADRVYHAYRPPDEQDKKAAERGEPLKIIYPVTYAQIQTTIAAMMAIMDRTPFFPLEARQSQWHRNSKLMELELDYQLEQAGFTLIRYQFIQDMLKYGFAVIHTTYERQMVYVTQNRPVPILGALFGMTQSVTEPVVGHEGASFELIDPYDFLFDPAFSIGEIQKGNYVICSWRTSYNDLKLRAQQPELGYFNLEKIPARSEAWKDKSLQRRKERDYQSNSGRYAGSGSNPIKGGDQVWLDQAYIKLIPAQYDLSETDQMQIWKITVANDATIVQAEPSRFEHGMFPVAVGEFNPDRHELVNDGMAQVIDGMQELINWLLNTHIVNVRKVLNDHIVVDPSAVELSDIEQRKPIWRLKPGKAAGVDRYVKQFAIQDVTGQHVQDSQLVFQILQKVTGVSDNLMGVETPTVRTATENMNVQKLAAGRITLLVRLLWDGAFRPLGQQLIQNTQQFTTLPRLLKVVGGLAQQLRADPTGLVQVSPADLQGFFSIKMINATTPTDQIMVASQLKEFLTVLISRPDLIPVLGADISQIATQMLMGFGIRNTTDFIRPPNPQLVEQILANLMQSAAGPARGVQSQILPNERVADMQSTGDLVQASGNGSRI